ncbi:hypothetical protein Q0S19_00855 [Stenotrophomonas indicatrix]|jgi:beta-lactamase superfamily II metal-dependent hydrolase|uniref:hypothetical protein n=1 Tax=Stenotrophomonas indicatrix TaxID=2045451 RepID=UPI00264D696D|nr:hypothetical protein [Stenotrophomonas indicatrix]MDN8643020.1 hypothetical protein [Stenotrophomonas indicatrix]MDN8653775.1 hypothetical protein [Stenotrophomonas indicatrix]
MATVRNRKAIASPDLANIAGLSPLAKASRILGVRVFDVGQGDSIAVLVDVEGNEEAALQLDYGGRERHPFTKNSDVDLRMPIAGNRLLMLTHWDEDHWCSASKGTTAQNAVWLVPRQVTSPRAVRFSATLNDIHCIPESFVGQALRFDTQNEDYILWEKIGSFPGAFAKDEDCNKSGVALAIVRKGPDGFEAILLPGDAPFEKIGCFLQLEQQGVALRGILAFHHGAGTHWTQATESLLQNWTKAKTLEVVFSCSQPNSYNHPDEERYRALLPKTTAFLRTADARANKDIAIDLRF